MIKQQHCCYLLRLLVCALSIACLQNAQCLADGPIDDLQTWLKTPTGKLAEQPFADVALLKAQAESARNILWKDYSARIKKSRAAEMKAKVISIGDLKMPFDFTVFGEKPKSGRSLFLSLHGGGGAPKRVNDQQWQNQKRLYKPKEGIYLSPRAPTDTWNLWHQGHIDLFFDRLIQNLVVFEDVNPNRVYVMGYSAGGDGVYQLAPRMADRWAAASMMAGHPNDASPLSLRNIGFTLHVGGNDRAYNRNKIASDWKAKLEALRKADPTGYKNEVQVHAGLGHWMNLRDAVAVPWMAKFTRNPFPTHVVWKQDDVAHSRSYWLAVDPSQQSRSLVRATLDGQQVEITTERVNNEITVRLNDKMLDLDKPVTCVVNGKRVDAKNVKRTIGVISKTTEERGDRELVFSTELKLSL
jgi:hypothetical protein